MSPYFGRNAKSDLTFAFIYKHLFVAVISFFKASKHWARVVDADRLYSNEPLAIQNLVYSFFLCQLETARCVISMDGSRDNEKNMARSAWILFIYSILNFWCRSYFFFAVGFVPVVCARLRPSSYFLHKTKQRIKAYITYSARTRNEKPFSYGALYNTEIAFFSLSLSLAFAFDIVD